MKKLLALLLALCLLAAAMPVLAEQEDDDLAAYFDSHASRVGNIFFTMDAAPDTIIHDIDLDRAFVGDAFQGICIGWKNKQQLLYSDEDREWQYHIADISGTIAEAREVFAGQDEMHILGNALVHFAVLTLNITGADLAALEPKLRKMSEGDVTLPMVTIDFEYDDMPGVPYRCLGMLDGDMAVLLIGNVDATFEAMADAMGVITPEQEALIAERTAPCEETLGLLTFTMPAQTGHFFKPGSLIALCFTEGYHMPSVEYMPLALIELLGVEQVTDEDLLDLVTVNAEQTIAEGGTAEVDLMCPGAARVKMIFADEYMGMADQEEIWFILTPVGCYTAHIPMTADCDILRTSLAFKPDADFYTRDTINELLYTILGGE